MLVALAILPKCTAEKEMEVSIIPQPAEMTISPGSVKLMSNPTVYISDPSLQDLSDYLIKQAPIKLEMNEKKGKIKLILEKESTEISGKESYQLSSNTDQVTIRALDEAGLFYGIQTLLQLIDTDGRIPIVEITDTPRFEWRGMMLDVSRHFFPKEYILKTLDYLAFHKLNTFHWHLVDDQGWRIEIKKYPKLTEIGAWRVDREDQHWNARERQKPGEQATYGGFYTQEDIKEIVKYAEARHITIVPEIEMPGHTNAAIAAYPQFACTDGPFTVLPGGVWPITDIYCAGKDETFNFLQDILTEVMELFPSGYIHIGGDEANKKEWNDCPDCQRRIKEEGLADEHELQSYFITRIEKFLNQNGRQLIGWDEILEGGLAPNAAVMSWRGTQGGIEAAKQHHPVVMSPTSYCYFDYYQGKPELEPLAIGGFLPLQKVYSYNPIPEELSSEDSKYILGVQANLWTEYVPTPEHADYMMFPRLCAISELAWTPNELKDFDDFAGRLNKHLNYLDANGIGYARSFANVDVSTSFDMDQKQFNVELSNPIQFGEIRFTTDGTTPGLSSSLYSEPFNLSETTVIKAASFYNSVIYSVVASEKVWIHKATGAGLSYETEYSDKFKAGGDDALTNSLRGSVNLTDGRWQGFSGSDLKVTIDLNEEKDINSISLGCLQTVGSWVFFPKQVNIEILDSDLKTVFQKTILNQISLKDPERKIQEFAVSYQGKAQYIRIEAVNQGICPDWHAGAGQPAWLFVDEIIIE